jgi:hypothetical protein
MLSWSSNARHPGCRGEAADPRQRGSLGSSRVCGAVAGVAADRPALWWSARMGRHAEARTGVSCTDARPRHTTGVEAERWNRRQGRSFGGSRGRSGHRWCRANVRSSLRTEVGHRAEKPEPRRAPGACAGSAPAEEGTPECGVWALQGALARGSSVPDAGGADHQQRRLVVFACHACVVRHRTGGTGILDEDLLGVQLFGCCAARTRRSIDLACQGGRPTDRRGEPLPAAGCNMRATLFLEQTVEVLRTHEGGTRPIVWQRSAEGSRPGSGQDKACRLRGEQKAPDKPTPTIAQRAVGAEESWDERAVAEAQVRRLSRSPTITREAHRGKTPKTSHHWWPRSWGEW